MTDDTAYKEFGNWIGAERTELEEILFHRKHYAQAGFLAGFRAAERLAKIEVLEAVLNYLCGKKDYTIIRCQKVTKDDMRKMFIKEVQ